METELTITVAAPEKEVALTQTGFMKAYLKDHGVMTAQQRKAVAPDEAGGELLPILTVIAPIAMELIKAIVSWFQTKASKVPNLKVKIKNQAGEEIELDASNFSERESELIKKLAEAQVH